MISSSKALVLINDDERVAGQFAMMDSLCSLRWRWLHAASAASLLIMFADPGAASTGEDRAAVQQRQVGSESRTDTPAAAAQPAKRTSCQRLLTRAAVVDTRTIMKGGVITISAFIEPFVNAKCSFVELDGLLLKHGAERRAIRHFYPSMMVKYRLDHPDSSWFRRQFPPYYQISISFDGAARASSFGADVEGGL